MPCSESGHPMLSHTGTECAPNFVHFVGEKNNIRKDLTFGSPFVRSFIHSFGEQGSIEDPVCYWHSAWRLGSKS